MALSGAQQVQEFQGDALSYRGIAIESCRIRRGDALVAHDARCPWGH